MLGGRSEEEMAGLSRQESRRRYSWWWDSHISPKNSRWLQENLTGMDGKVKQMIKIIEEDADSFARRADMYYKRRPELMRLVEEFYRAYRALAERYDHATGVIRHAHKTMVEAFPDQVASLMNEEIDVNSPFMPPSVCEFFDADEMQKDALGLSSPNLPAVKMNGDFKEEPEFVRSRRGLKQLDFFENVRAKNGVNFNEGERNEKNMENGINDNANGDLTDPIHSASQHEADIVLLKESLAKLEAEKEAGLVQYEKSLERLSNLEKEIMLAQEESKKLSERATQAESEVELLRGALVELKAEKELVLFQYQQCLEKISILEDQIFHYEHDVKETNDRANRAENEVHALKQQLAGLQAEKEAITAQHNQCTDTISMIETKLQEAEENARRTTERAEMAESKVDNLNLAITELTEEKEAYAVQCQQYLERISSLEFQIFFSQEENQRLNEEVSNGLAKLKSAERHCLAIEYSHQSLQSELDHLIRKMESQNSELAEKQTELGRLWTCVQEERSRFVEAETAFQTLQHLHNESQEEVTALAMELEKRAQMVADLEAQNFCLQEELMKIKEEHRTLNEIHLSTEVSMGNMKDEISNLRAKITKLQEEIEIRVNERNALQHEIYRLRVELNDLKQKYGAVLEHVESLVLDPRSFASSVKELRDSNTKLNEVYHMEKSEKAALVEKLESMAKLLQKNALLENSIADLNIELQQAKDKVKTLEEACQMLMEEKSAIVAEKNSLRSQFQILSENSSALSKKNVSLENSLADAYAEMELLKEKSRILEESLLSVGIEKTRLLNEFENLSLELNNSNQKLKTTELKVEELETRNCNLKTENKLLVCSIGKLRQLLDTAMQENSDSEKLYQTQLANLECQLQSLQEEAQFTKYLYNEEVDKFVRAEIEMSILQTCLQELHGNRSSLGLECHKFFEESQMSEKLITELEQKNADQQVELEVLYDALELIRLGFLHMLTTFDFDIGVRSGWMHEDKGGSHFPPQPNQILGTLEDIKKAIAITLDQNQQLVLEKSVILTLLEQLRHDATNLDSEKYVLSQNLKSTAQSLLKLLSETHILLETNEGLQKTVEEGEYREKTLRNDMEELNFTLLDVKGSYKTLEQNNNTVLEEKKSLIKEVLDLKGAKVALEEEIHEVLRDAVSLNNTILVFKHFFSEKSMEVKELDESLHQLYCIKIALEEVIRELEEKLEAELTEKSCLIKSVEESKNGLKDNIANGEELLHQKEMELSDVKFKLQALLKEQIKLYRSVEDLKGEYDNVKAINRKQAEQIAKLVKENGLKSEENEDLRGSKHSLETALFELRKKHENARMRELTLKSEVQRWRHKERMYEKEFVELFSTLQISAIQEACYLDKFHDLRKEFESLVGHGRPAEAEARLLKEKIRALEAENAGLKAHLSDYESAANSLSCSMASLDGQTIFHEKSSNIDGAKGAGSMSLDHTEEQVDTSKATLGAGFSELKNFQSRIEAVELAVEGIQKLASGSSLGSSVRAQASDVNPDDLESGRSLRVHRVMSRRQRTHNSYASTEVTELPKDIMLDQISACSSYGLSRREITPADDHMLELWGTSKESSMNCRDSRAQKFLSSRKEISISGIVAKEEMAVVEKLEVCKSPKHPQQKRKNVKILERLHFDAQKLENLQKTVQDLRTKVETAEKNKTTTDVLEYDTVKEQLEEAEEAIEKLFCVNERLTQTVEDDSASPKSVTENGSNESMIVRRRRVLEQIRRASEKISRLNFEVQKLQFHLQKLEGESKETVKARIIPRSPRVRLQEYLYGGTRPAFALKQKRIQFCGCIRPPTKGE